MVVLNFYIPWFTIKYSNLASTRGKIGLELLQNLIFRDLSIIWPALQSPERHNLKGFFLHDLEFVNCEAFSMWAYFENISRQLFFKTVCDSGYELGPTID